MIVSCTDWLGHNLHAYKKQHHVQEFSNGVLWVTPPDVAHYTH